MTNKIISNIKKILFVVTTLFLCTILFLNISTMLSVETIKRGDSIKSGYALAIVNSGSMEPTISKNNLVIIKARSDYYEGTIATYISENGTLITHRITQISDKGYVTQGDSNNTSDNAIVQKQRFLGEVILVMPGIGTFLKVISTPIGMIFVIVFPINIILIAHLIKMMRRKQEVE